jgi:Dolichyl-phosphate-mannose-protein mannosyltransferase
MVLIFALLLFVCAFRPREALPRLGRLGIVAILVALVTSYFWLPFLLYQSYMNVSPYLQRWKYESFGANEILGALATGELFDLGRLPILTLLVALGACYGLAVRTKTARLSLSLFAVFLALFFGPATWGRLAGVLPMHDSFIFHRFIGMVDLSAILLIGLGGEWLWNRFTTLPGSWRTAAPAALILLLMLPVLRERWHDMVLNQRWIDRTRLALDQDRDARTIIAALSKLPQGRTYAGLRANWGKDLAFGDLHFRDLLTFYRIVALSPPYSGYSLNSDLIWHFDDSNPSQYDLFNVRYVVAPAALSMPKFLTPLARTSRYILYNNVVTTGYAEYAAIIARRQVDTQSQLFAQNLNWFKSADPAARRFIRYDFPAEPGGPAGPLSTMCPGGRLIEERVAPSRFDFSSECSQPSTIVLKVTYHPNWRVFIDGHEETPFMVSPSFIGIDVPAGRHHLTAEYRSSLLKNALLLLGAVVLAGLFVFHRAFDAPEAAISQLTDLMAASENLVHPIIASRRFEAGAVVGVTGLAALLRFYHLGTASLWIDEAFSWKVATIPWHAMLTVIASREASMGLYYLLLRPWIAVLGTSEAGLRSLSAVCSVATVVLIYRAGKRMFGAGAGIAAALLFAVSPLGVVYARDARSYPLEAMLVVASLIFFLRTSERPTAGNLAGWIASSVFAAIAHVVSVTVVPAELLPLLLLDRAKVPWRRMLSGAVLIGTLLVPFVLLLEHADHGQLAWIPGTDWSVIGQTLFGIANGMTPYHPSGPAVVIAFSLGAVFGLVALIDAWSESAEAAMPYVLALSGVFTPFALAVALSFFKPMLYYRYLIFTLPSLCLFVAAGIVAVRWRAVQALAIVALVAAAGWHTWFMVARSPRYDWREPALYVVSHAKQGDAIAVRFWMNRPPLDYYFSRMGRADLVNFVYPDYGPNLFIDGRYPFDIDEEEFMARHLLTQIDSTAASGRRLWFVVDGESMGIFDRWASLTIITQRMSADYGSVSQVFIDGFRIYLCTQPRAGPGALKAAQNPRGGPR